MLIYLDTNVVSDIAKFIFGDEGTTSLAFNHQVEVSALQDVFDIGTMVDLDFEYLEAAFSRQLEQEFLDKQMVEEVSEKEKVVWSDLRESWHDCAYYQDCSIASTVSRKQKDHKHWQSAHELGADFLLTRDLGFVKVYSKRWISPGLCCQVTSWQK